MKNNQRDYIRIMRQSLELKQVKNPLFKQNSFAKSLNYSKAYVSKIINGKLLPSLEVADDLSKKLCLKDEERMCFILSILQSRAEEEVFNAGLKLKIRIILDDSQP